MHAPTQGDAGAEQLGLRQLGLDLLTLQLMQAPGVMGDAGIAQHQAGLQLVADGVLQPNGMDQVALILELDQVEPTKGGGVLILPATGDAEAQALGLERQLGDLVGVPAVLAQLIEHRDGCRGGR